MGATSFRILHRNQHWSGLYEVVGGEVRVDSAYGSGRLPLGRRKPHAVAGEILFGLVDGWCKAPPCRLRPSDMLRLTEVFQFRSD